MITIPRMRRRSGARGQALAEMGIVVVLLVMILMGIVEFGRMLMLTNMVVHAARDGARIAAVTPGSDFSDAENHTMDLLATAGLNNLTATATQNVGGAGGVTTVTMTVQGELDYLFIGFAGGGPTLQLSRSVTFRKEAAS
jgi:Flp pilus assembly protein TadG